MQRATVRTYSYNRLKGFAYRKVCRQPASCKSDMASFVDSLVAPLSLINALIVAVSIRNIDRVSQTFERLEKVWAEYDVYAKSEEDTQ